jgi:hypothetical protein
VSPIIKLLSTHFCPTFCHCAFTASYSLHVRVTYQLLYHWACTFARSALFVYCVERAFSVVCELHFLAALICAIVSIFTPKFISLHNYIFPPLSRANKQFPFSPSPSRTNLLPNRPSRLPQQPQKGYKKAKVIIKQKKNSKRSCWSHRQQCQLRW